MVRFVECLRDAGYKQKSLALEKKRFERLIKREARFVRVLDRVLIADQKTLLGWGMLKINFTGIF